MTVISTEDFLRRLKQGEDLQILDIRSQLEFDTMALDYPVIHCPLHEVSETAIQNQNAPTYILCKAGPRAFRCFDYLRDQGVQNLVVVDGGLMGCAACSPETIKINQNPVSPSDIQMAIQDSVQKFMQNCQG